MFAVSQDASGMTLSPAVQLVLRLVWPHMRGADPSAHSGACKRVLLLQLSHTTSLRSCLHTHKGRRHSMILIHHSLSHPTQESQLHSCQHAMAAMLSFTQRVGVSVFGGLSFSMRIMVLPVLCPARWHTHGFSDCRSVCSLAHTLFRLRVCVFVCPQVEHLVRQAISPENLCQMYEGWTPWI